MQNFPIRPMMDFFPGRHRLGKRVCVSMAGYSIGFHWLWFQFALPGCLAGFIHFSVSDDFFVLGKTSAWFSLYFEFGLMINSGKIWLTTFFTFYSCSFLFPFQSFSHHCLFQIFFAIKIPVWLKQKKTKKKAVFILNQRN